MGFGDETLKKALKGMGVDIDDVKQDALETQSRLRRIEAMVAYLVLEKAGIEKLRELLDGEYVFKSIVKEEEKKEDERGEQDKGKG